MNFRISLLPGKRMNILGIKFAPFNVPLERRFQTLAAAAWFITFSFGGVICSAITLYLLLYTKLSWLVLLYVIWMIYDWDTKDKGGRHNDWVRNWIWWKYFRNYFPLSLVKTAELPPDRNYLLAVYPHGLLSSGAFGNFATNASDVKQVFPGIRPYVLTLNIHFISPFFRELPLSLGTCPASRESIMYILNEDKNKGKACVLVVGGAKESLNSRPGVYKIVLKDRKGFIKIAILTGTSLVPVFSFGENDLYDQVNNPPGSRLFKLQEKIRKLIGFAPCIPVGRGFFQYNFGIVPRRCPVTTVVGKPIEVKKNENPSNEEIQNLHNIFTTELVKLFEKHKHKYIPNADKTELIIE